MSLFKSLLRVFVPLSGLLGSGSKSAPAPAATPTPTATSRDVQLDQERQRRKLAYSSQGLSSTIFTSALGDTSTPTVRAVNLGGL